MRNDLIASKPRGPAVTGAAFLIALAAMVGCRTGRPAAAVWPAHAERVIQSGPDTYFEYDLDADGRLDYVQRLHEGYKDRLYFPRSAGGPPREVVTRPASDPSRRPLLVLLLDGVAYERMRGLYDAGRFRLFRPPARLISVFPTLTDPAYDVLFGTGPTPGYEAEYFDRAANRLSDGVGFYLRGGNERWARYTDYRLNFLEDAVMYLTPRSVYGSELRRAREVLDRRLKAGAPSVVIYLLSTDAVGHMLPPAEIDVELARLDAWVERTVYEWRGQIEIVMLADHGMSAPDLAGEHLSLWDLPRVLRDAGFRVTDRLERPGDVVVPLFGLLDLARLHTYDAATRRQVSEVLRQRDEVEVLAARDSDAVRVYTKTGAAVVRCCTDGRGGLLYSFEATEGDPLGLADACAALRVAGRMDAAGFASARAWLEATGEHAFPAAPPRLWDGLFSISREQPDVVLSLNERFYVGSGVFSRLTRLHGTHGGLQRRATETFVMTTSVAVPSPCDLPAVRDHLDREFGWEPTPRR
jgi:hypothetical protein